jgi:hypothetical protein
VVVGTPCRSSNARGMSAVVMVGPCAVAIAVGWSRSIRRHWPANRSPSARVTRGLSQCVDVLMQVAVVVDVVATDKPNARRRFDDREQVIKVLVAVDRAPRVDDDWLASADHIKFVWTLSG